MQAFLKTINDYLALIVGVIVSLSFIIKPIRNKIIAWIKKITRADESSKSIERILTGIDKINGILEKQKNAQQATMREFICRIYDKYLDTKKIPKYDRESLVIYYNNYKDLDGNHDIDAKYEEMERWDTIRGDRG
jgi:hypothetical protein